MHFSKVIASCALAVATLYSPLASADLYSFTTPGAVGEYTYQDTGGGLFSITNFSLAYNGLSFSCVSACATSYTAPTYLTLPSLPSVQKTGSGSFVRIIDGNADPHQWVLDTYLDFVYMGQGLQSEFVKDSIFDEVTLTAVRVQQPSAVPVPAALPLMASGLAAFGLARRRKTNV